VNAESQDDPTRDPAASGRATGDRPPDDRGWREPLQRRWRPEPPPAEPYGDEEIARSGARPDRLAALVLAAPERLAANIAAGRGLPRLLMLLLVASVLFAIPYGAVLGVRFSWRVAVLYLGSTLICFPALHVFCSYLGSRVSLGQNLTLALTIPAVAALFTFGFAPILGFLRFSIPESGRGPGASGEFGALSYLLLAVALFAGVGQLWRCLRAARELSPRPAYPLVLLCWHVVFLYVLVRMGEVLGLS
jgi:hypothetical protein